jgi:hypothetical protein
MIKKHKVAFNKLKALGIPVKTWDDDSRGYFYIDCEEYGAEEHLDYYSLYWGSDKLNSILKQAGLYYEWYNPAYACVYDD